MRVAIDETIRHRGAGFVLNGHAHFGLAEVIRRRRREAQTQLRARQGQTHDGGPRDRRRIRQHLTGVGVRNIVGQRQHHRRGRRRFQSPPTLDEFKILDLLHGIIGVRNIQREGHRDRQTRCIGRRQLHL